MNATGDNRRTVLIVDDDPAVLVVIQQILMAADYRALLAAERAGAIRLAQQKHIHIDLVLLDVRIPGVSGTALADEILSIRPDIRVLWMSGIVDKGFIRIRMLDGYAGFLRRDGLLAAVQQAIEEAPHGWGIPAYQGQRPLIAGAGAS